MDIQAMRFLLINEKEVLEMAYDGAGATAGGWNLNCGIAIVVVIILLLIALGIVF